MATVCAALPFKGTASLTTVGHSDKRSARRLKRVHVVLEGDSSVLGYAPCHTSAAERWLFRAVPFRAACATFGVKNVFKHFL